jgi:N-acetylmuramic acid 6-phosphate etherase
MAGGMPALTKSAEGAEDIAEEGRIAINQNTVNRQDIVIGVAASGTTPYTVGAVQQANALGALTIGIANKPDTPLLREATHPILIETGREIIAGSTRMKAGTTQKIVLNMISTAIMVKLGRVYKDMMVDMIISNKKLDARAISMVCDISKCSKKASIEALTAANHNIKIAVLIARGQSLNDSMLLLEKSNGNLRIAMARISRE